MVAFDARIVVLGVRIAQAILAMIVLGVAAYVVTWWRDYWHVFSPSPLNFFVFDAVWTFLALAYLVVVPWRFSDTAAHHPYALLGVEAVTTLFWFAGFLAAAVWLTGRPCWGGVCSAAKAATVFGAFEWVCFVATTVMAGMYVWRGNGRSSYQDKADPNVTIHDSV